MGAERRISIVAGAGGWTKVSVEPNVSAFVRFALNADKRTWRAIELRIVDPTSDVLRSFPLQRVVTAANADWPLALGLSVGIAEEPPADLGAYFERSGRQNRGDERYQLERPAGRRLDAAFYERVARAYREAAAAGLNPRQTLARDSGAAVDTVARWVAEARRRGHLPPGQPGRVTA